jgi:catechol 2,3-dioxygenase-like lactoylglutathione lyase family enzyme
MNYLHTMVRISNLDISLDFYCNKLGLIEVKRTENEQGRFTLIFLVAADDLNQAETNHGPMLEPRAFHEQIIASIIPKMFSLISGCDIKSASHRFFVHLFAGPRFHRHSHPVVYKITTFFTASDCF